MVGEITIIQLISLGLPQACSSYMNFYLLPTRSLPANNSLFTLQNALNDGLVAALLVFADGSCTSATCTCSTTAAHDCTATRELQTLSQVHIW